MYVAIVIVAVFIVIAAYLYGRRNATIRVQVQAPEIVISRSETPTPDVQPQESSDKDSWEGGFWDATKPLFIEITLEFDYTDSNGEQSFRLVDVRQFDEKLGGGMIIGFCHHRQATRTFRIDRIGHCIVYDTGEVVEDLRTFLRREYEKSAYATTDRLLDEEYNLLRVLLYVGKADGRLMNREVEFIAQMCREVTGDQRITGGIVTNMLSRMEVPNLNAFRIAVGKLVSLPEERRSSILRKVESMIGTKKNISAVEQDTIAYLKKKLTNKQTKVASPVV